MRLHHLHQLSITTRTRLDRLRRLAYSSVKGMGGAAWAGSTSTRSPSRRWPCAAMVGAWMMPSPARQAAVYASPLLTVMAPGMGMLRVACRRVSHFKTDGFGAQIGRVVHQLVVCQVAQRVGCAVRLQVGGLAVQLAMRMGCMGRATRLVSSTGPARSTQSKPSRTRSTR